MATITLAGNTNVSALTIANGDTIDLAGFVLTLDVQSTATTITVQSPATAGTVVFSGGWDIPTWSFLAGTTTMISTLPAGAVIGLARGGTSANAACVSSNSGTIGQSIGGSASNAFGCNVNVGTITTSTGGSASASHGCSVNSGFIGEAIGSAVSANAQGCTFNRGTVGKAIGSTANSSFGVNTNDGAIVLRLKANTGSAVGLWRGTVAFVFGPEVEGTIAAPISTIYSFGEMNLAATLPVGATVVELSEGGSSGFTGIRGTTRTLGT